MKGPYIPSLFGITWVEGDEKCHNKTVAMVDEVPEETCDLFPKKVCKGVYRLVPYLVPKQECRNVPHQICSFGFHPAVREEKPITTKWCYDQLGEKIGKDSVKNNENGIAAISELSALSLGISRNPFITPVIDNLIPMIED